MADALWLAGHISPEGREQVVEEEDAKEEAAELAVREDYFDNEFEDDDDDEAQLPLSLPKKQNSAESGAAKPDGIPIKAPAAPALRIRLELARALRPLRRSVPSPVRMEFDQAATIDRIADQGIWSPVLSPAPERWLDVALVIEESKSVPLWKETLAEFQTLLERQGAFRSVSSWRLRSDETGELTLLSGKSSRPRSARELLDPAGRRLILMVSDCTSTAWQRGTIYPWLETWGEQAPMTVIQLLPERLWAQTGLAHGTPMWLSALEPGVSSTRMMATAQMPLWDLFRSEQSQVIVPVVSLEAEPLKQWANVVIGTGESRTVGFRFEMRENLRNSKQESEERTEMSAEERVRLFRATASLTAQKLAGLMSAAPVSSPIVNLIRQTMLPEAEPVHIAEVYMGGLMEAQEKNQYDFVPEVRDLLADTLSVKDTERVLDGISLYISKQLGLNTHSFEALLCLSIETNSVNELLVPFAHVAKQVLHRIGGDYASVMKRMNISNSIEQQKKENRAVSTTWIPPLQIFKFREAIIEFEDQSVILAEIERYDLTNREAEVWRLRQQGTSYGDIAQQLFISVNTVKKYLKNIFTKINRIENEISPEDFSKNENAIWKLIQSKYQYTLEELSQETGIDIEQLIQHINNIAQKIEAENILRALVVVGHDNNHLGDEVLEDMKLEHQSQVFKSIFREIKYLKKRKINVLLKPSLSELKSELNQGSYNLFFYSGYVKSKN
ncbi:LuxR C-terminal-related transcriptional regulator, partial [Leptolyngbya ectocarpi]